jgi:tetratricopeptide (TPR) repeat protein
MAGNREAFQQLMNKGHNAAWDQEWPQAIKAYSQAIHEFPEDPEAHINLGLSLLRAGRLNDSFKVYSRAHQLAPDDPIPLEKSADVLERMGRLKEAAQQYVNVADVYFSMRDLDKAVGNWERATQLTPGLISIHAKLAQAYERIGDKKRAMREYLTLAFNFQRMSETNKAIKAVERSLRLDRRNPQALNTLRALRSGGEVILPKFEDDEAEAEESEFDAFNSSFAGITAETTEDDVGESHPLGPMGEAMSKALIKLADHVVESGSLDAAGGEALKGMEFQRQGLVAEAISAYKRAESKLRHPALKFNLGTLLVIDEKPDDAVKHLGDAVVDPSLSAGALHALGKAYYDLDQHKKAARYLLQSLQAVDTSLAVDAQEATELGEIYNRLLSALDGRTADSLKAVNSRFLDLLSGRDWKQRIAETRRHLEEVMRDQGDQGVVDFLGTGGSDKLAGIVSQIDTYIRQGLLTLAMESAHSAVEISPYYLPIHVRMAEIMMREGRLRQAIKKYNAVARSYMARDENDRAASILSEVLEMAPLDVSVRKSLIELLESEERLDEVLEQYIDLAKTYNQLGNFDPSREMFQQAERLAKRIDADPEKIVIIKHNLADMDQMRLDTRRAIKTYEEIVALKDDDERAYRMLVDLNYNLTNQVDAIRYLDKLLGIYARKKKFSKIVQLLEELVKLYPNDTGLRSRLAQMYRQMKRKSDAIDQLDVLGELQLEAGMQEDARKTIQQIIKLGPDNMNDYKRLLSQLGG